jgi:hypothetical protein
MCVYAHIHREENDSFPIDNYKGESGHILSNYQPR